MADALKGKKTIAYRRVLLKISGESFGNADSSALDYKSVASLADEILESVALGVEVALVVGGGNILRGRDASQAGLDHVSADYMGMLATIINALSLQSVLEKKGAVARVMSAIPMRAVCEPYIRRRAIRHMENGRIVIFAAGTGNPFVTTDTAAALRAAETSCDAVFKATQVDGIYSEDPKKNPKAERYDRLTYRDVLEKRLEIMDFAAITLCRENGIPLIVFSNKEKGAFSLALQGQGRLTTVTLG